MRMRWALALAILLHVSVLLWTRQEQRMRWASPSPIIVETQWAPRLSPPKPRKKMPSPSTQESSLTSTPASLARENPVSAESRVLKLDQILAWGNEPPPYPAEAEARGWEGEVTLQLRLTQGGLVQRAQVKESSGYLVIDSAALGAAERWRLPGQEGVVNVPIEFRLMD